MSRRPMPAFKLCHGLQRCYWRLTPEGQKTSCQKHEATHVEIVVRNGAYKNDFMFELKGSEEPLAVWELTNALEVAFTYGYELARADIRQALGV